MYPTDRLPPQPAVPDTEKGPEPGSRKGLYVVLILAAQAGLLLAIYLLFGGKGASGQLGREIAELVQKQFDAQVRVRGVSHPVSIEIALAVEAARRKEVAKDLERLGSRIRERMLELILSLDHSTMHLPEARRSFKHRALELYNDILVRHGKGSYARAPVQDVLIRAWRF